MEPIRDFFGTELSIGDLCLSGRSTPRGDTDYNVLLVSGRTAKMARVMKTRPDLHCTSADCIGSYASQHRNTARAHGAVLSPWNLVRIGDSGFTEAEIKKIIEDTLTTTTSNQVPTHITSGLSLLMSGAKKQSKAAQANAQKQYNASAKAAVANLIIKP